MNNFSLKRPKWLERLTKALSVIAAITMVFNMSALGVLLTPQTAYAANPSANLDQCANDPAPSPSNDGCSASASEWVNGNLGASKSVYYEGDSIPYRMLFDNLTNGSHTVTIEWDTTKSGKHAIDYLTTFNRTVTTADPTLGVSGLPAPTTFAIPNDPQVTGAGVTPVAGNFTLYGGTITNASAYSYSNGTGFTGDKSASITLTFTSNVANPVLSWGGHISTRTDWGTENSAVAIPGSPYHTRLIALDGSGGNQDRSLSAEAVIYPASITIIKDATPNGSQSFDYTTTGGLTPSTFSLIDDGTTANTKSYTGITNFTTYSVSETPVSGWDLNGIQCSVTSANSGSQTVNLPTVSINLAEGENVTCTYTNDRQPGTISGYKWKDVNSNGVWDNGEPGLQGWTINLGGDATANTTTAADGSYSFTNLNPGNYTVSETQKANWIQTYPGNNLHNVTLAAGQNASNVNFGNVPGACNLVITKSVNKTNAVPGDTLTYTLNFQNTGTADCTGGGVRVDDVVPTGVTYNGTHTQSSNVDFGFGYDSFGTANPTGFNGSLLSWNAHTLTPGESGTVTFQATVNSIDYCTQTDITNKGKIYSNEIPSGIWSNQVSTHVVAPCNGTLKVVKYVDSGNLAPDNWSFTVGNDTKTPSAGTNYVTFSLPAGTYTATESAVAGYHQVSSTCNNVSVVPDQQTVCEFHNAEDRGHLTVIKHVVGSNEPASSWTMNVAGTTPLTFAGSEAGVTNEVVAGNYTVTESNGPSDYTLTYSGDCDAKGNVTIANGDNKTCTLTNTRDTGTLRIKKFEDINNNGVWDAGNEPLLTGWDFTVKQGANVIGTYTTGQDPVGTDWILVTGLPTGDYTVTETLQSGWTNTTPLTQSATVTKGATSTKYFGNFKLGKIYGYKWDDVDQSGDFTNGDYVLPGWTICIQGGACTTTDANGYYEFTNLNPGTYTVYETVLPGWMAVFPTTNHQVTISTSGQSIQADFFNFKYGKISGHKFEDVNGNGAWDNGEPVIQGWNISLWKNGQLYANTTTDASGEYEFTQLTSGSYVILEDESNSAWTKTMPANTGYGPYSVVSGSVFENNDFGNFHNIDVKVCKYEDMNGDGNLSDGVLLSGWTVNLNGQSGVTGRDGCYTFTNVGPGSYSVSETQQTGWVQTYPVNGTYSFDAVSGQDKAFDFGNFETPKLTVIKHVINDNGGTAVASDFTMNVTGTNVSNPSFSGDENGTTVTLDAGSYSVDEGAHDGYAKSFSGNCSSTVQSGDEKTCTITNDDNAAHLTLEKFVVNDNGGTAVAANWTLKAVGPVTISGSGYADGNVNAGTYTLSELNGPSGYSASNWTCTGDGVQNGNQITLGLDESAYCKITNDDISPKLTVIKHVINDNGGTAVASDFTMNVSGTNVSDDSFAGAETPGVTVTLNQGAYSVDEDAYTGYAKTLGKDCSGTINVGEEKTCTITNDDIAPKLKLVKTVINDDGGTLQVSDFPLFIDQSQVTSGVWNTVTANHEYTASETSQYGYAAGSWTGDCSADGKVTLNPGDQKICYLTNDDIAPKLTVIKHVINDNGGTAVASDFTMNVTGTNVSDDSFAGDENGTTVTLDQGAYSVDEGQHTGYTKSFSRDCSGTINVGDHKTCTITNDDQVAHLIVKKHVINDNGGTAVASDFTMNVTAINPSQSSFAGDENGTDITLDAGSYSANETAYFGYTKTLGADCSGTIANGETKTCVITNDDISPKLTVIKHVINDNGGTAVASDFTMNVTGTNVSDDSFAGAETPGVTVTLNQGAYSVDEDAYTGYAKTLGKDCSGTINVGEEKTCTITNDDITAHLKLIKVVTNNDGGSAVADDWTLKADGPTTIEGDGGTEADVPAGTYTLSEYDGPSGYTASSWVCDNGSLKGDNITLALAESATCTITNDDQEAHLIIKKHVINDNGGTLVASDFTMNVTATDPSQTSFAGDENGTDITLDAGSYSVDETYVDGYAKTLGNDCSGTIANGETKTCVITNDDIPGRIVGHKFEDVDHSGDQNGNEGGLVWTFYLRTGSPVGPIAYTTTSNEFGYFEFPSVDMGTYYLTEEGNAKWDMTVPANGYYEIVVTPGYDNGQQEEYFEFGNVEKVTLDLDKWNDQEVAHGGDGIAETNETINYQIDWSVAGNSIAQNVVLVDTIPAELNIDEASITASDGVTVGVWDSVARTITWDFGTQQPNASGFVNYSATVIVPIANGTLIHNVAKISADNSDPLFLEDDSDVTVESLPIMTIDKTVDIHNTLGFVNPGDTVTYTVVVSNTGTDTLINAKLSDTLPDGFLFADTLTPTKVFDLGDIAAGDSVTTTYDVIVGADVEAGFYDNLAVATADNHTPVDDTATVEVRVPQDRGDSTKPILTIDKTVNVQFANPGDTIQYTVVLKNTGDGQALDVTLTDYLPTGFTFDDGKSVHTWDVGSIDPGKSWTMTYNVKIGKDVPSGQYENLAMAKSSNHKPIQDRAQVEVRIPRVLGESVPNTGVGFKDLAIFIASLLMIIAGALFIHEGRKRALVTNK